MVEAYTLSEPQSGSEAIAEKLAELDLESEDWEPGWTTTAWLGSWDAWGSVFSFNGHAIRYWTAFACLPEKPELEYTYWIWPIGCDEEKDGWEEKKTESIPKNRIEEQEDGTKWVKSFIVPEDGYRKRLVKVKLLTPCGSGICTAPGKSHGACISSMQWWVSLGRGTNGNSMGNLRVEEAQMGPFSATPSRLSYDGGFNNEVEVIKDEWGGVRQVLAPEAFADVVVDDQYGYEIRFYNPNEVDIEPEMEMITSGDEQEYPETYVEVAVPTGRYVATNGAPFSVWKIENPDGASADNRIKIIHEIGEGNETYLFEQDGNTWTLDRGDGGQEEEKTTSVYEDQGIWYREYTVVVKDGNGTPSYKAWTKERFFAFGLRPVEQVIDPDGAALSTTWTYYTNEQADGGSYAQVKQVIHPNGTWERYEYDSEGRITKHKTPWLDAAPGAADNQCRVVETAYQENQGELTSTTIEKILGVETGRRYWIKNEGGTQVQNITCTVQGAGVGAGTNLVNMTNYVSSGDFKGKTASVQHSNGALTIYGYQRDGQTGALTTTVERGEASGSTVIDGTRTVTIEDAMGRLVSREERDIATGILIEGLEVVQMDEQGRPTRINYSDGTYEEKAYACCGVEWERDRNGMLTSYTYDALKRVLTETRAGLTTIYGRDGSGRVLTVTRRGTDSSEITVVTNTYDLAGRQTSSKNALNYTTTYSESVNGSGQTVRTTTLPGGSGIRVEVLHRDGNLKEISGSAAHPVKYEYGTASGGRQFVKEIKVGDGGSETEWTKSYTDMAGRQVKIEYPNGAFEETFFNNLGQRVKQVDADGIATLYGYNGEGEQTEQAIDASGDGSIGVGDRRTRILRSVVSGPLLRTTTQEGDGTGYATVSVVDTSPNGHYRKESRYGLLTVTETTFFGNGNHTEATTLPDGSTSTTEFENGRPVSTEQKTGGNTVIRSSTTQYDPHGRLWKQIDGRTGTQTVYTYNSADQVISVNAGGLVTSYALNSLGQPTTETLPGSGRAITRTFLPTGEVVSEDGTAAYPVTYTYDPQGRRKTMSTSSGITIWTYDSQRGWLTGKTDADNKTVGYTYTAAGRLQTRTWARGITTSYGYNAAGDLNSINYSDSTPGITLTHDEQGRLIEAVDATGARTLTHNAAGQLASETVNGGLADGLGLEIGYDALLRRSNSIAKRGGTTLVSTGYSYDSASRLAGVNNGTRSASYSYLANSSLVGQIAFNQGGGTAMTTTKTYDNLDRLSSISSVPASGSPVSYGYQYNAAGFRDQITLAGGDYWDIGYNTRGEVTSGARKQSGGTPLNGYQFGYAFDAMGNRETATVNGRAATYSPNSLNQYEERTVPGYVNVVGSANASTTVTVNGQSATRQGTAYHRELNVTNTVNAVYLSTEVVGTLGSETAEREGKVFVPRTPEEFVHDDDGNLLSDGRWNYTWDGENRLIGMETTSAAGAAGAPKQKLSFSYDYMGRRSSKKVEKWSGTAYVHHHTRLFIYDGWNLVAEVLANGPRVRTYVWGNDLSGSPEGAGGVGGLLLVNQYPESRSYSVGFDGNGNVTALFDMADSGEMAAYYEYGPFGESLVVTGLYAEVNPMRWSTKYQDRESGLAYYGFRFYNPETGRWLNRDPIEERGGINLYGMVSNDPINKIDPFGLSEITISVSRTTYPTQESTGVPLATIGSFTMDVKIDPKCKEKFKGKPVSGVTMEPPPLRYNMNLQFGRPKLYPIPAGTYDAEYGMGPTGENFKLKGVSGFSGVWIHGGSTPLSSEGCILVGSGWQMSEFPAGGTRPNSDVPMPGIDSYPFLLGSAAKMAEMIRLYKEVKEFDEKCCSETKIKVKVGGGR